MKRIVFCVPILVILAGYSLSLGNDARGVSAQMAQIESRPGIRTRMIVFRPGHPSGMAILFPDGSGLLEITHLFNTPQLGRSADVPHTLIHDLLREQIAVVLVDAPADHHSILGLNGWHGRGIFRLSADHARDVAAVVAFLQRKDRLPIWLIGIRMGAFSAATAAIHLQHEIAGLVVADGITRCPKQQTLRQLCPEGLMSLPLHDITIPTLIVSGDCPSEQLLTSALVHAPKVRHRRLPPADGHLDGRKAMPTARVLVSEARLVREMADFMRAEPQAGPILVAARRPGPDRFLEMYLAECYY